MEIVEETPLASWQEALPQQTDLNSQRRLLLIGGGVLLVAGAIVAGFFLHDWTWYLAAAVVIAGEAAVFAQNRRPTAPQTIQITSLRIIIGERDYSLEELKGFRLESDGSALSITFEPQRRVLLPPTCYYQNNSSDEAAELLEKVLPELEPLPPHFTDRFFRYFRF